VTCPPALHATAASDAPSRGHYLAQVAELMGISLYSWQRQVADVALELDEAGRFRYRTIGVSVGRQNGKSALIGARVALEMLAGGHVAYTAQDRSGARNKYLEIIELMRPGLGSRFKTLRLANGSEQLTMQNGATFRIVTPNQDGARGLTLDLAIVDEALTHSLDLIAALQPTMATRPSSQLWIASNAGDHRSELLMHYRDIGRAGDSPTVAWFEWAAEVDADPTDEATWHAAIPTLSEEQGVQLENVRNAQETMTEELFAREWLNVWPTDTAEHVLDSTEFQKLALEDVVHGDRFALGVDISPMRDWSSIAIASKPEAGGFMVEIVDHRRGTGWIPQRLTELSKRWNAEIVVDSGSAAGSLLPHLRHLDVVEIGGREYAGACATFYDAVKERKLFHTGDPLLANAVAASSRRRLGDRWAWKRTDQDVPIAPLVSASLAMWGLVATKPKPTPQVF